MAERLRRGLRIAAEPATDYRLVAALFLRLLALSYLAAFASIGVQIAGLAGPDGILPFSRELELAAAQLGPRRFWLYPNLFWLDASAAALQAAAAVGCLLAVLLFFNRWPRGCLVLLFLLYLSLLRAGQVFMNFQWDYLLLESGFLAIFLPRCTRLLVWLYRWLLFRLRFLSGLAKLASQDPSWAGLTALGFYFETQPLPHIGAWYAHQLPDWLLQAATAGVLIIELLIPFLMFLPRGPRFFAAWVTIGLQLLILLTSNHNFFNLLTIALCLFLFDDRAVARVVPERLERWLTARGSPPRRRHGVAIAVLAAIIVPASSLQVWEVASGRSSPRPLAVALEYLRPWRIVNKYGVFATMKTTRLELVVEGSRDGTHWRPYRFRYKPGALDRVPRVAIPHQPRLDWLLWFMPSGHPVFLTPLDRFAQRLIEGSPAVIDLLAANPFPEGPPRHVRAALYRYRFTDPAVRAATGRWWEREYWGPFYPWPWLPTPIPAPG